MGDSLRLYLALVILVGFLVAIAVLGSRGGFVSTGESLPPQQIVNRIAYVSLDGQIRSVRPDGSDERQISPRYGIYTGPTWSPDGRRLLFSGLVDDADGNIKISLYVFKALTGKVSEIYTGDPSIVGFLAEGVLHYPLWSPNGRRVAFIAVTSAGLTLLLDDLGDSPDADFVLDQGPLWMSWSPDSRYLLVHRGVDHFLVNPLDGIQVSTLNFSFGGYRTPAWKPIEGAMTVVSERRPGVYSLYTSAVVAGGIEEAQPLAEVVPGATFLWSADGKTLALTGVSRVLLYQGLGLLLYRDLTLLSQDKSKQPVEINDNILAYFWSPDATKLAYVTLADTKGTLRWMVFDMADGSRYPLAEFIPSRDQLILFQFFDQYAYSHSLWSPDSRSLVFAGRLITAVGAASFGSQGQGSRIIVVSAGPNPSPRAIAEGVLGIWSPR